MYCTDKIKRITAGFLTLLLISAVSVSALADEGKAIGNFPEQYEYSVPGEDEDGGDTESGKLIVLSDGTLYNPSTELFYRKVENSIFGTSVPDRTITTEAVSAYLAPGQTGTLYRNGVEITGADLTRISEPGKYVLAVSENNSAKTVRLTFTVVSSPTGSVKEYILPEGFFVVSAMMNGEKADYSRSRVDMTKDGDYEISYRSPEADKDYFLSVTIDHTPPTVTLSTITAGKSNDPVTVSDVEDGAKIYLSRNGKETEFKGIIDETGAYVLTVQDEAGNETSYEFAVIIRGSSGLKFLGIMAVVLVLALAGYFVYYRKYIRVN